MVCAFQAMTKYLLSASAWLVLSGTALAQQPAAPQAAQTRADFHAVIGWQNLRQERGDSALDSYNNWANGIFYGGAGAGWYWNAHLKTQVDYGAGTRGRHYQYRALTTNGQQTYESSRVQIQQQSVAVSQQYQFFENQWFHPHVAAGLDIARETRTEEYQPVFAYDPVTRVSRQVSPARTEGPDHRMVVRPFGEVGFKAYMTRRTFFTGDTRLMFRGSIDEVLFRVGFGIDF
jgi:hypothetical protein